MTKPNLQVVGGTDVLPPLLRAADAGQITEIRTLVEDGVELQATDAEGRNAVQRAIKAGHEDAAVLLLHFGADPFHADAKGETALHAACRAQMDTVIERIARDTAGPFDQQTPAGKTALMLAIEAADGWAACRLLRAGADARALKDAGGNAGVDKAALYLDDKSKTAFFKILTARETAAAEEKRRELRETVQQATVLSRDIQPLKTLRFGPKKPGYPSAKP